MQKLLLSVGVVIVIVALLWNVVPMFRLPGDIHFGGNGVSVYIPITSSILLSVLLWLVFVVVQKFG